MLGFLHSVVAVFTEILNIYFLVSLDSVNDCIKYFIAMRVIILLPKYYYSSFKEDPILEAYNGTPYYVGAS